MIRLDILDKDIYVAKIIHYVRNYHNGIALITTQSTLEAVPSS